MKPTVKVRHLKSNDMYAIIISKWFGLSQYIYATYFTRPHTENMAEIVARRFNAKFVL